MQDLFSTALGVLNMACNGAGLITDPPKNLWLDFTDPVIPAQAGIQMLQTIVERLSFSKEYFWSNQLRIQIPPAWV
ncbi:MAG: hypothetical protein DBP02_14285 [gamma proteobacterium symbiont of Ctena orbiculata]|nr:MAG: hypothetical protein DBP02_14285 [gamma proteobacterium symbiont of Ctena orbiculata]